MADVSIYIPCYNAVQTIAACLEGVFAQSFQIKEVVVVDDGSSDRTAQTASRFRVRLIRHEANRGLAAARNSARRQMDAEFIASVDADCVPDKEWLKNLMRKSLRQLFRQRNWLGGKSYSELSSGCFFVCFTNGQTSPEQQHIIITPKMANGMKHGYIAMGI